MYLYQQMFRLNLIVLFPLEDHMHQLRHYDALRMVLYHLLMKEDVDEVQDSFPLIPIRMQYPLINVCNTHRSKILCIPIVLPDVFMSPHADILIRTQ